LDGLINFFHIQNFKGFTNGPQGEVERRDVIAFVLSFSTDTHAGVGAQVTLRGDNNADPAVRERLDTLLRLADSGAVGLIANARPAGVTRGFAYSGEGLFEPARAADAPITFEALLATAAPGSELTFTLVPLGTQRRLGVDRNADGIRDGDELGE